MAGLGDVFSGVRRGSSEERTGAGGFAVGSLRVTRTSIDPDIAPVVDSPTVPCMQATKHADSAILYSAESKSPIAKGLFVYTSSPVKWHHGDLDSKEKSKPV